MVAWPMSHTADCLAAIKLLDFLAPVRGLAFRQIPFRGQDCHIRIHRIIPPERIVDDGNEQPFMLAFHRLEYVVVVMCLFLHMNVPLAGNLPDTIIMRRIGSGNHFRREYLPMGPCETTGF